MTCPDCGRKKWIFMETPLEGHCAALAMAGVADCLLIALARERSVRQAMPKLSLPMMLHCPQCRFQHIDAPRPEQGWTNPPHKSHLCHICKTIWRPADVPTEGVAATATRGTADTFPPARLP